MDTSATPTPHVPDGVAELDEDTQLPDPHQPELLIITGMSGAGRSRAAQALEDLDWYVVDNLPPHMLVPFADLMTPDGGGVHRLAAVVDIRSGEFFDRLASVLDDLSVRDVNYRIVFLDAETDELVRRYESNRRPHPAGSRIIEGIARERDILAPVRQRADVLIDTTRMNVHDLARHMRDVVAAETSEQVRLTIMSFGFKHGIPLDADWVADMRFLVNPYWVEELRNLTGLDAPVYDYVMAQPGAREFGQNYVDLLEPILSGFARELKPFITVAIGCTGGRHRSVAMTEFIAEQLRDRGVPVRTLHRDAGKE